MSQAFQDTLNTRIALILQTFTNGFTYDAKLSYIFLLLDMKGNLMSAGVSPTKCSVNGPKLLPEKTECGLGTMHMRSLYKNPSAATAKS